MLYICSRIIIINLFKIIITMFGKPSDNTGSRPSEGTYMCQLYKIAHLGLIRSGNSQTFANQVRFVFQPIAKIEEEKDASGKTTYRLNFEEASKCFREERGLQPFNIHTKTFGNESPLRFFQSLVMRQLTETELIEGFNPIKLIGKAFTLVVEDSKPNARGQIFTNIASVVKPTPDAKAAKAMDMARAGGCTFNETVLFHVSYDMETGEPIETASQLITSKAWTRLDKSERRSVLNSREASQFPDKEILEQFRE